MAIQKLDHIGIIVRDLDTAIVHYRNVLDLQVDHIEDYGDGLLRIAFLPLGELQLELIQPLRPGSSAWDFLHKNGEGIEHIAFQVQDIEAELQRLIDKQVALTDVQPRQGAGNTRISFLKRESLCGVLGEIVAYPPN